MTNQERASKAPAAGSALRSPIVPMPLGGYVVGFDFSNEPYGTIEIQTDEEFSTFLGKRARVLIVPDCGLYRAASALANALADGVRSHEPCDPENCWCIDARAALRLAEQDASAASLPEGQHQTPQAVKSEQP